MSSKWNSFISFQPFKRPVLAPVIVVMINKSCGFVCFLLVLKLWMWFWQDPFVASDIRAYIHVQFISHILKLVGLGSGKRRREREEQSSTCFMARNVRET
jgi:hypothetical protein